MAEDEINTPVEKEAKPFFAIDSTDVAEANAVDSSDSSLPPQPIMMGSLGGGSTVPSSTPSTPSTNAWGSPTAQLSGDVATPTGQQMFTLPETYEKERFRWGQFFIGLTAPFLVLFVVGTIGSFLEPNWDAMYRFEDINVESQDGVNFEHQVQHSNDEYVSYFSSVLPSEEDSIYINGWVNDFEDDRGFTIYQETSNGRTAIGQYYPSNQTIAFTLTEASSDSLDIFVEIVDVAVEDNEERATSYFDTMFCLVPLGYLVATIGSFVKGNRALGIGLITSLFASVVVVPLLFVFFLMLAFGV